MTTPIREKMIEKVAAIRDGLKSQDPRVLAFRSGTEFQETGNGTGVFRVRFYGTPHLVDFPALTVRLEGTGKECGLNRSSLFLYYLQTADGTTMADKWIAYRELPGGMFYHDTYQGYSGDRLAKAIDNCTSVFEREAARLGGTRLSIGDAAFAFQALPRVRVAAVYYAGDEDFPATANVLFDAAASHYLPTDVLSGVGSTLVDRLTGEDSRDDD